MKGMSQSGGAMTTHSHLTARIHKIHTEAEPGVQSFIKNTLCNWGGGHLPFLVTVCGCECTCVELSRFPHDHSSVCLHVQ